MYNIKFKSKTRKSLKQIEESDYKIICDSVRSRKHVMLKYYLNCLVNSFKY